MSTTFAELGVPADLVATLKARGVNSPFPIQTLTVADGCAGRDLSGRAPTGSGKTLAFGIPLAARIGRASPKKPRALVLVPTRELAGGHQHQGPGLLGRGAPDACGQGDAEGEGLARTGRCPAGEVAAGEAVGHGQGLDRERAVDAPGFEGGDEVSGNAELGEGGGHGWCAPDRMAAVRQSRSGLTLSLIHI